MKCIESKVRMQCPLSTCGKEIPTQDLALFLDSTLISKLNELANGTNSAQIAAMSAKHNLIAVAQPKAEDSLRMLAQRHFVANLRPVTPSLSESQ